MPVVDPSKLVKLQDAPDFIRNVSFSTVSGHGSTTNDTNEL